MSIELFIYMPRSAYKLISFFYYVFISSYEAFNRLIIVATRCKNIASMSLNRPRSKTSSR